MTSTWINVFSALITICVSILVVFAIYIQSHYLMWPAIIYGVSV